MLPRFGESLQAILDSSKNVLSVASAANIAKQIVIEVVIATSISFRINTK